MTATGARAIRGLLAASVLAWAGCGGGGSGPTPPQSSVTFTPAGVAVANSVALSAVGGGRDGIVIAVNALQIAGLYGVAFDLAYPSALLRFDGAIEGTVLNAGATPTAIQVAEPSPGRLVIGLTRLWAAAGVTSATGEILELTFSAKPTAGSGSIEFSRNAAFGSMGESLSGLSWIAGSVAVVP